MTEQSSFNTPILFLIFNRPGTTQEVFNAIKKQRPKYLYVAADGARETKEGEKEICLKTRDIINQIDWDCELKTLFRDKNLGCGKAISSAITWFFEQVEYGIILEDDCLPDDSFFPFCEELLIRYKDDDRIGHISGDNFLPNIVSSELSYDFCSFAHIWGWASWRRVWKNYDVSFSFWNKGNKNDLFVNLREKIYFSSFISDVISGKNNINTWDIQHLFMLRLQSQLSIYPTKNLVVNIGLGEQNATHTGTSSSKYEIKGEKIDFPLKHPDYFLRNKKIDIYTIKKIFFSWKRLFRYIIKDY